MCCCVRLLQQRNNIWFEKHRYSKSIEMSAKKKNNCRVISRFDVVDVVQLLTFESQSKVHCIVSISISTIAEQQTHMYNEYLNGRISMPMPLFERVYSLHVALLLSFNFM